LTLELIRRAGALVLPSVFLFAALAAPAQKPPRSTIVCYTSYDSEYFYVAAVVTKPNLVGKQTAPFSKAKEDDAIGVTLQSGVGPIAAKRTARSVEMVVSVAGGVQLYRGANAVPLEKFSDFLKTPGEDGRPVPFKFGVKRKGNLNGASTSDTGYSIEMAIPWIELGEAPTVGQRMRFNVVAYSADAETPHILSLSPGVKSDQDVQNPSLWADIVFVDAPVRSVASAPDAKVSARLYTAKPLIDGELEEGPWNSLTAFGFAETEGGAAEALAPTTSLSRTRPKVPLRRARPPISPTANKAAPRVDLAPHTAQPVPKLVFTHYQYDYQNDARKQAPFRPVRTSEGATKLSDHPMSGTGPWMTYDRLDWHRGHLIDVRKAGIDVILPIYGASASDKQHHSVRGIMNLVAALKQLEAESRDYPVVGLHLATGSLTDSAGEKIDLTTQRGKLRLYAAIKEFFLLVPNRFRAAVPLSSKNGGGDANVVFLSDVEPFSNFDGSFETFCRTRFKTDFGADLLILGDPAFKGKANLDGYLTDTRGRGFQMEEAGWIKPASVGPGYSPLETSSMKSARKRLEGETYRKDWKQALAKQPTWVFVDGWNDFEEGSEIAPSLQHGVEYVDLTRVFTQMFRSGGTALRASYLSHNVPSVAPAKGSSSVAIRLTNAGAGLWTPDSYAVSYQWSKGGGAVSERTLVKLPESVRSNDSILLPIQLKLPEEPGAYTLVVDVAQIGKKGDVTAMLSGLGSPKLEVPVHVAAPGDPMLPSYALTVVANDLTTTAEAGGSYAAKVTLRNDGAQTWKKGGGGRVIARVWRYTSPINSTAEKEALDPVTMSDAGADLISDVAPGQTTTLVVPITFSTADDSPLRAWSQADSWNYQLRWEYSADEKGSAGAVSTPEPLALVDADFGVQFTTDITPEQLPGERRQPVRLGVRNVGPQTWAKGAARVGYHWYYLDGAEAVWQDETTPLPQELEPGGEVTDMLAWVAAPPFDGTYWLVWDVKIGETWASTLPSVRTMETLVRKVEVVNGKLILLDMRPSYNQDGVAGDAPAPDGAFDTSGRAFPEELVPPFTSMDYTPVGMWLPNRAPGADSRKISFRWGPKSDKQNNLIQCVGQKVPLGERKNARPVTAVHLLAASTKDKVIGSFVLQFEDGSEQLTSFPLSRWDSPPTHGEEIAYFCRYSRTRAGDDPEKPVALYHYVIKVTDTKKLVSIQMPNAAEIKVAAITLEK
jgi:hypothetical protein